ncbi:MAG: 3-phosphoshikimate 1-carboxyvinyltransferase, partial [Clostridia bacterium]|nr:3-phosphoshikimate 1-carboxyvinyltransferase [Clostridia bacterium]
QTLSGTINAPPSKNELHRVILCAALADGNSEIQNFNLTNDIMATINAIKILGARVSFIDKKIIINGSSTFSTALPKINCDESSTTLRLLIPMVASRGVRTTFLAKDVLYKKPLFPYFSSLLEHGVAFTNQNLPFTVSGNLTPGKFTLRGDISSQFLSGLLISLPSLKLDSEIILTSPLESSGCVDLTIDVLSKFGIEIIKTNSGFWVPGKQTFKPTNYTITGDWSLASFFAVSGAIGEEISIKGLSIESKQADKSILKVFERFHINHSFEKDCLTVSPSEFSGANIFAAQTPDLVPPISILSAFCKGSSKILGTSRLKYKESNRLKAIYTCLNKFGVEIWDTSDGFIIKGSASLSKCSLNSFADHRVVMAMAIAATVADGKVYISDAQSIHKSYPHFFEDFIKLGGRVNVVDLER